MSQAAKKLESEFVVHVAPELEAILPQFLEDKKRDMETIARGLKSGNLKPAQVVGHQMKGIALNFGFPVLSEIGEAMENAAAAGRTREVKTLLDRMKDYMAKVEVRFDGEPL